MTDGPTELDALDALARQLVAEPLSGERAAALIGAIVRTSESGVITVQPTIASFGEVQVVEDTDNRELRYVSIPLPGTSLVVADLEARFGMAREMTPLPNRPKRVSLTLDVAAAPRTCMFIVQVKGDSVGQVTLRIDERL